MSEEKRILELIRAYEQAFEAADADRMAGFFWVDDPLKKDGEWRIIHGHFSRVPE